VYTGRDCSRCECVMSCIVYTDPDAPGGVAYERDPYYPDYVRRTCLYTVFLLFHSVDESVDVPDAPLAVNSRHGPDWTDMCTGSPAG